MNPFSGDISRNSDKGGYPYPPPLVRKYRGNRALPHPYQPNPLPPSRNYSGSSETEEYVPNCPNYFVQPRNHHLMGPAPVATGWNYPQPSQQRNHGLVDSCCSIPPGFGFIAPPQVRRQREDLPRNLQPMPATIVKSARGQGEKEEWYDNEEEKQEAFERYKQNDSLMEKVVDERVANCQPIVVPAGRVESLQRQSDLLQKELDKEQVAVVKTQGVCDTRMNDFLESTANFYEEITKLSRPISTEVETAMIEKHYNELKQNPNENGGFGNEIGCWKEGITIPHSFDWKPSELTPKVIESTDAINTTYGSLDYGGDHVPPRNTTLEPMMTAGSFVLHNYYPPRYQSLPPQRNMEWMPQQQQPYGFPNPNYAQGLSGFQPQFGAPPPPQIPTQAVLFKRYLLQILRARQLQRERMAGVAGPPPPPQLIEPFSTGFYPPLNTPPRVEQRGFYNQFIGGFVGAAPPPSFGGIGFGSAGVGVGTHPGGQMWNGGYPSLSGNDWASEKAIEGQREDAAALRSNAPKLASLLEAPCSDGHGRFTQTGNFYSAFGGEQRSKAEASTFGQVENMNGFEKVDNANDAVVEINSGGGWATTNHETKSPDQVLQISISDDDDSE